MTFNWGERGLNNVKALLMLGCHWKEGRTLYLPKNYEFKHSIPDFLQWLCANKVIWKSFFLLAPVKCLLSLKYFSITDTEEESLIRVTLLAFSTQRWHTGPWWHREPLTLLCQVTFLLLPILCQTGCRKNHTKCLTRHFTFHLPPLPFIVQPTRWWEGRAELTGKLQPAGHPPLFRGFPRLDSRILEVFCNLNGSVVLKS